MFWYGDHMGAGEWAMAVSGWLFMVALVALAVWLVGATTRPAARVPDRPRTLDVLDEAYARGELDRETYLQRKGDLSE